MGGAGFSAIVSGGAGICVFMYPLFPSTECTVSIYTHVSELMSAMRLLLMRVT